MKIAIGADHAGFLLKQQLRDVLTAEGHAVTDFGTASAESCDYPDYALAVSREVAAGRVERGILVCSTGVGMSIAANKVRGVRAALATSADEVGLCRAHNDANVLTLGSRYFELAAATELIHVFLTTNFDSGARHSRRVAKIATMEADIK